MLRSAAVLILLSCAAAASSVRAAAVEPPAAAAPADPRVALLKLLPAGSKLEDLRPSPIAGIYEFMQGAEISYITADGKFFIDGNVYDMKSRDNLTEALRTHARVALISSVPESEMLIFSPPNPKYTITVFTDVDCQYCRKLHSQIAEINRLGIRVRYMFFPRTGPGTELEEGRSRLVLRQSKRSLYAREGGRRAGHEQDLRADAGQARI